MSSAHNLLIERMAVADRRRVLAASTLVDLSAGELLCGRGIVCAHAYFPVDGFVAIEVDVDDHPPLEVAMVGREGMVGLNLVLGVPSTAAQSVVQGAGSAWRIGARALRTEMSRSPALKRGLDLYVSVVVAQFATAVACRRFHEIAPRLARWLLMSRDRTSTEDVQVTHEVLATLLGVRRVGITMAAGELQRLGLIAYHRGHVTVLDRPGLEAASCSCYATDLGAYSLRLG